jgi:cerevisin
LYETIGRVVEKDGLRSFIVAFTDNAPVLAELDQKEPIQKWLSMEVPSVDPERVENVYNIYNLFRGFAAYLNSSDVEVLRAHSYVQYIQEDAVVTLDAFTDRQDWGQIRINNAGGNRNLSTNSATYTYAGTTYPNQNLDVTTWNFVSGVQQTYQQDGNRGTVCVVDTGIRATHSELTGRVDATTSYVTGQTTDGNGHGTHVAGSCCGRYRGVARAARISSAKVLADNGSGTNSAVISGINWCANRATDSTRTYIISMSLGGDANTAVNDAINAAGTRTVPVVAGGNDNGDACNKSPASARMAITIAASDKDDTKASFSNHGPCVDLWAPGVSIHSSWYTSDTAYNTISGTSMATPLVSGLVATYANLRTWTRDGAVAELERIGVKGAIKNCPTNTKNILASTGR